jgi:tyrosine-protein kinase Etk/Wzc
MATTYTPESPRVNEEPEPQPMRISLLNSEEIGLLDLLLVQVAHRRAIFRTTLVATIVGLVLSLLWPATYTGRSVMLTPLKPMSVTAAIQGELGSVLSNFNSTGSESLGLSDANDVYIAMLTSDTVARAVIARFDLMEVYKDKNWDDAIKKFESSLRVASGHDGTITIEFDDHDPQRAAAAANGVVEAFEKLSASMAVTEAAQRRLFFGNQLETTKNKLADAEVAMTKAQESTGLLDLDKQTLAIVTTIAQLQGGIAAQEVLIQGLRSFGTNQNPEVIRAQQELAAMRAQLANLERRNKGGEGNIYVATKNIPTVGLEYLRRFRDVQYYETIYMVVAKQYEAAVIDESSHGAVVQVVDPAIKPDRKSKPKRSLIVLAFLAIGFVGSCAWAIGTEISARLALDPIQGPKLAAISQGLLPSGRLWNRIRQRPWRRRDAQ